jgi:hypothetical protein
VRCTKHTQHYTHAVTWPSAPSSTTSKACTSPLARISSRFASSCERCDKGYGR